jgi:hypothetical protein
MAATTKPSNAHGGQSGVAGSRLEKFFQSIFYEKCFDFLNEFLICFEKDISGKITFKNSIG